MSGLDDGGMIGEAEVAGAKLITAPPTAMAAPEPLDARARFVEPRARMSSSGTKQVAHAVSLMAGFLASG